MTYTSQNIKCVLSSGKSGEAVASHFRLLSSVHRNSSFSFSLSDMRTGNCNWITIIVKRSKYSCLNVTVIVQRRKMVATKHYATQFSATYFCNWSAHLWRPPNFQHWHPSSRKYSFRKQRLAVLEPSPLTTSPFISEHYSALMEGAFSSHFSPRKCTRARKNTQKQTAADF